MGISLMEFGSYASRGLMFTVKECYRSVYNHPLLICVVCALIHMARSFPFMFSLLVSASPVIVCTAVLLGTLLFYGHQNIHETEVEMKTKYEVFSLKNRLSLDASVEKCGESKRDDVDSSLVVKRLDEIHVGGGSVDGSNKGRMSFGVESENREENGALQEVRGEWDEEREREKESVGDGELMADHYALVSKVIGELLQSESDHDKSEGDSCDSERRHREEHNEDEEDDEGLDSESDRSKCSSHDDTSIDEIMPMLDEIHPLLDEETAQPPPTSHAASEEALAENSPNSSISSVNETDLQELEAADYDDDDDDDEAQDEEEDHSKSIITWTEEDQRNLMEVGDSENERNKRLERILRRRKNRSMVPEINLMNFENSDFQFQIPPISTARQNPFDLPNESLPSSAPSVLSQRRNPFDIACDDPNEMAEESRLEHKPSLTRHPFMRRRDNFTARPSIFSPKRLERRPVKLKPFFVADKQTVVDESTNSKLKQSSGKSSAVDTESVASVEILEDGNLEQGDDSHQEPVSNDQETADMTASSALANEAPRKGPVYDTDTSPSAEKRAMWEAEAPSSSYCDDGVRVEHSVNEGESVGAAYHQVQAPDSTSMDETAPQHPEQGIRDSVEIEK